MKKITAIMLILFLAAAAGVYAGDGVKYEVGKKVAGIQLKDLDGRDFDLAKALAKKDVKGVVFVFVSEQCPVSNACDERYVQMAADFKKKGILFIGINSNYTESVEIMKKHAEKNHYNFPVLKDWKNVIADRFGAEFTPHAYFIGKDGTLLYRGRIDDNHRRADLVKETTLRNVVNEYLSGKKLSVTETISNGCSIKRVKS